MLAKLLARFNYYNYDFILPKNLIANFGLAQRDSAKLLVVDTKKNKIHHDYFYNLDKYIPLDSLIILNKTKVVKARLFLYKETGGRVECFVLANEIKDFTKIPVMVDRKVEISSFLFTKDKLHKFEVTSQSENIFMLSSDLLKNTGKVYLSNIMEKYGEVPLPKYITNTESDNKVTSERYQTIFADTGMSVAAPTASLHFTNEVFRKLENKSCKFSAIYLEVGQGTFKNPTKEQIENKTLHTEPVYIPTETHINLFNAKQLNRNVVCVGTTATRAIESFAQLQEERFDTSIFIQPGYSFQYTDIMITNFHLPNTSLMMLVQAFLKYKKSNFILTEIYKEAISREYRFYSFGDSMLIL